MAPSLIRPPHPLQLSSVDLYSCAQVDDAWLEVLATTSPQLKDINLGYCADVTLPGLERFGAGCPQLGSLRLAGCWQVGRPTYPCRPQPQPV